MELNSRLTRLARQLDAYQPNQLSADEWQLLAADRRSPVDISDRALMANLCPQATFVFDTTSQESP